MKKSNKKGFTIVELVIVIAVIAILAAVLIPTFSGVVDKANASAAQQTAKSSLTNALTMSSTAQLPANTKIIVDGYAFNYTGNQLESTDYPTSASETYTLTTQEADPAAKKFNALIISADSLTDGTNAISSTDYTAKDGVKMTIKNIDKVLATWANDNKVGCIDADITNVVCVKVDNAFHYYVNYGLVTEDDTLDSTKTYYTQTGAGTSDSPYLFTKVESPIAANLGSYYELTYDAEIYVNSDLDKDVVVFTKFG